MGRRSLPRGAWIPGIDADPHAAARDLYARLLDAWNAHDADAFAALFAADGVSIGFDGSQATGDGIREHLAAVFGDHETAAYIAPVRGVREIWAEAVEEHTAEIERVRAAGETIG